MPHLGTPIIFSFLAAGISNNLHVVEAELSSIWGADSPGWKVVSGEDLGPKNRTYKYDVDYFAVSILNIHVN